MRPGDVIAERFKVERRADAGGMGDIYRALDLHTGAAAALKVLRPRSSLDGRRLAREADILAAQQHPGIVRYLGHGQTDTGDVYLAMEWLMGETLSARLSRSGLTIEESVALGIRVAEALGAAHARGVVHRDLKPANVFLRGSSIESPVLIDFGIARLLDQPDPGAEARPSGRLTLPGAMVGTPGYMAPEQVRGELDVDPRADVFSLGCVLFKCLTGRSPFEGDDTLAILFRVVIEEPPTLGELCEEMPSALSGLVTRMLSKERRGRPADGARVALELAALRERLGACSIRAPMSAGAPEITTSERRLMCLVAVRREAQGAAAPSSAEIDAADGVLHAVAKRHQGRVERLADGSILIVLTSAEAATDLAARAARCALAFATQTSPAPALPLPSGRGRDSLPEGPSPERPVFDDRVRIAIVSGRAVLAERLPVGELIDRAVTLLDPAARALGRAAIRLDVVTVGLLGARFQVGADAAGAYLVGELRAFEAARMLLGKPTPCVGRERELALLSSIVARSIEEGMAGAVLVTAAAGVGKSRLRSELLHRLEEQGDPLGIWIGQGDPLTAGSAFGLLAQALRSGLGIVEGKPLDARRRQLAQRVAARLGDDAVAARRIAAFLGELVGTPFPDEDNVQLRAARRDPVLMGDQMHRAFEEFLAAECAAQPVLLVLEDLHWGDLPTVKFIDAALRKLRDQPLIVLSFARPEVHSSFRDLWADRPLQIVQLGELGRKAAEQLVRLVLGEEVSAETMRATVERAAGNALYLEELIRAVAQGQDGAPPETVLSMVQARIEGFDAEARRVLRAASIFGKTFWAGGVSALLGGTAVVGWLRALAAREVIFLQGEGATKFPGEIEYRFRHSLVHEAAYGMLTERDRAVGHKLAGEWLERAGEGEAGLLGEHFERGEELGRALAWYRRAAEQALEGDDIGEALRWIERARSGAQRIEGADAEADPASREELGRIRRVHAEAHRLRGEFALAEPLAREARSLLPRGSEPWFAATSGVASLCSRLGRTAELVAIGTELRELWSPEAESAQIIATAVAAMILVQRGEYALADDLLARLSAAARPAATDPQARARILRAQAMRTLVLGDVGHHQELIAEAAAQFTAAGDRRNACSTQTVLGFGHTQLGFWEEAERELCEALAVAERMGLTTLAAYAQQNLGFALARRGALAEARAVEIASIDRCTAHGDARMAGSSRGYLAMILAEMGDLAAAEGEATTAIEELSDAPPLKAFALSGRARIRLSQGRSSEALTDAREAVQLLRDLGGIEEGEAQVRLVHAEALGAAGDLSAARAALGEAHERLLERAAKIADPAARQSFLHRVPEHERTLVLYHHSS